MNNLQVFNNPEFGEVRTIKRDGEPWFVGKDVAAALGYAKERNAISSHVDDEDKKD
ncbi:MAG: Bro-N domain-containing protein, partial [Clostridium sp.]